MEIRGESMNVLSVKNMIESMTAKTVYINSFPDNNSDCVKFILSDNTSEGGQLENLFVRFSAKASHPLECEKLLLEVRESLHNRTDIIFGEYQLVVAVAETVSPIYEGTLENGQYFYSLEVTMVVLHLGGTE